MALIMLLGHCGSLVPRLPDLFNAREPGDEARNKTIGPMLVQVAIHSTLLLLKMVVRSRSAWRMVHFNLLPPRLPPFQSKPPFVPYATEKLAVMGSDGSIIVRNTAGQRIIYSCVSDEAMLFYELLNNTTMNPGPDPELDINSTTSQRVDGKTSSASGKNNISAATLTSLVLSTIAVASVIITIFGLLSCRVCPRRGKPRPNDADRCLT